MDVDEGMKARHVNPVAELKNQQTGNTNNEFHFVL